MPRTRSHTSLHRRWRGSWASLLSMCLAVVFLDSDPEQPQVADLPPQVGGKKIGLVDRRCAGRDLVARELLHGRAQHVDRFAVVEIERGKIEHRFSPRYASALPCITISVCCISATRVRFPCISACTSPLVIASVRPGLMTNPSATSRSPMAGASRLSLNSTVSTELSAGNSVKPA